MISSFLLCVIPVWLNVSVFSATGLMGFVGLIHYDNSFILLNKPNITLGVTLKCMGFECVISTVMLLSSSGLFLFFLICASLISNVNVLICHLLGSCV